jgi:AmmeMemoRadiSam system protein A
MSPKRVVFWRTAALTTMVLFLTGCRTSAEGLGGTMPPEDDRPLTVEERAELLRLARETIAEYLERNQTLAYTPENPVFLRAGGAFVTLKKHTQLRGCIGYIWAEEPIYETVQRAAIAAAVRDPRFPPVTRGELDELTVEISLLSPMKLVADTEDIVLGRHGLFIRHGYAQGLLLPQVAPEQGWTREQFLEGICRKAGLPMDALNDPTTELFTFTAEVFAEEH